MTRLFDNEDWQLDDADWNRSDGARSGLPSFLREDQIELPAPTDINLSFPTYDVDGPSGEVAQPQYAQPQYAQPQYAQPHPSQGYSPLTPASADSYELPPGSFLHGVEPLPESSAWSDAERREAELWASGSAPEQREWDPLCDPWPGDGCPGDRGSDAAGTGWSSMARDARAQASAFAISVPEPIRDSAPVSPIGSAGPFAPGSLEPARRQPARADGEPDASEPGEDGEGGFEQPRLLQTQPFHLDEHPSGPLPRTGAWPPAPVAPASPAVLDTLGSATIQGDFDVTLTGPLGQADLGFRDGRWHALAGDGSREVSCLEAVRSHPEQVGQIVQVACWWMRQNPDSDRALDLATELAMATAEIARAAAIPLAR